MTSSLSTKVWKEQIELDRLQQPQLREHSANLQAIVRLLNNMRDIRANKKLTSVKQLNSISCLKIQFDKLKKETGLLSSEISFQVARNEPLVSRTLQL